MAGDSGGTWVLPLRGDAAGGGAAGGEAGEAQDGLLVGHYGRQHLLRQRAQRLRRLRRPLGGLFQGTSLIQTPEVDIIHLSRLQLQEDNKGVKHGQTTHAAMHPTPAALQAMYGVRDRLVCDGSGGGVQHTCGAGAEGDCRKFVKMFPLFCEGAACCCCC